MTDTAREIADLRQQLADAQARIRLDGCVIAELREQLAVLTADRDKWQITADAWYAAWQAMIVQRRSKLAAAEARQRSLRADLVPMVWGQLMEEYRS